MYVPVPTYEEKHLRGLGFKQVLMILKTNQKTSLLNLTYQKKIIKIGPMVRELWYHKLTDRETDKLPAKLSS